MSAISSIGPNADPYQTSPSAGTASKPGTAATTKPVATTTAGSDPDHDGDIDGKGLDVNG
jgi:hypothetical protein